ncbi:MAG: TolC family protein [Deltaproteobacteria bacterium]|nr:TolC family protein [Deltaproteobacteria bacterium]
MTHPGGPSVALALLLALGPRAALAQTAAPLPSPLTVEAVAREAVQARAEPRAARAEALARAQRPTIVSTLEDPMLMASVDHLPVALHGVDMSLLVEQRFPLSRVLSHRRRGAEADARAAAATARESALDVALEAVEALWMLAGLRRMRGLYEAQRAIAEQALTAATARYGAGLAPQADALRAAAERARWDAERRALDGEVAGAEAMLAASVGRDARTPVPEAAVAPPEGEPEPLDALAARALRARPALAAGEAARQSAQAEGAVMRSMYAPMAFVRAGPAYTMTDGPGAMVMLGVSIPLWRARLHAGVAEADAMTAMRSADLEAMRTMLLGQVARARGSVLAARARREALRDEVLPAVEQSVAAALEGYAAGRLPLVSVLEAATARFMAREQEVMADVALGTAWARLARATGALPGGSS